MALSRKHFVDLADVVVEQHENGDMTHGQTLRLLDNIAFVCQKHSNREAYGGFDYNRFQSYVLDKLGLEHFDNDPMTKELVDA